MPIVYNPLVATALSRPLEELDLSTRTYNCLIRAGIHTIFDVVRRTPEELLAVRNLSCKCLDELESRLEDLGLKLMERCDEDERVRILVSAMPYQLRMICDGLQSSMNGLRLSADIISRSTMETDTCKAIADTAAVASREVDAACDLLEPSAGESTPEAPEFEVFDDSFPDDTDSGRVVFCGEDEEPAFMEADETVFDDDAMGALFGKPEATLDDGEAAGDGCEESDDGPFRDGITIDGTSLRPFIGEERNYGDIDPESLLINYNAAFADGGTAPFREEIVGQTLAVLVGRKKPNALLVGPAGTGKTRIAEDIAFRLAKGDSLVPRALDGYTVWELPLANIVAGSNLVGQVEQKAKAIIEYAEHADNKVILFIDEIHMLIGDHQVYGKIAQILKPALARGTIRVIGATTLQESSLLANDPAFNRRFSRLLVDELTREQTLEILRQTRPGLLKHYGYAVTVDDDALEKIAVVADRFSTAGSHRPDNALTLLDRAMGDALVDHCRQLGDSTTRLTAKTERDSAMASVTSATVDETRVRSTAIALMTGHSKRKMLDIDELKHELSVIRGQDNAIEEIVGLMGRLDAGLFPQETPVTVLLAGPSGTGKSATAKIIAQELTDCHPITLNMTEFTTPETITRIIGVPSGYVGSDSNMELPFDGLESNPYQVILLDEFEKCDDSVQRLFMSAFDDGWFRTNKGKLVDFSKAIIIATTNAAEEAASNHLFGFTPNDAKVDVAETVRQLSTSFDTALLNRFQKILLFNPIDRATYRDIVEATYRREAARIVAEHSDIALAAELPTHDADAIVDDTYLPAFGARPAYKAIRRYIEGLVA